MKKNIFLKLGIILSICYNFFLIGDVNSSNDMADKGFTISVSKFAPIANTIIPGDTLKDKSNNLLLTIIELLMVSIGVIALLVVSIGAGYMIFYNGKEEFLTKGRSMVFTGFLALFIALISFYLINLVRYILYN